MAMPFCFLLLISFFLRETCAGPEYDFEDAQEVNVFSAENARGIRTISPLYHKSGAHSLLWQWSVRSTTDLFAKLTISLGPTLKLEDKELRDGGLKFWMYREAATPATIMEIIFRGENGSSASAVSSSPTIVNLNFQGWRGVWIGYQEFVGGLTNSFTAITSVEFKITSNTTGRLFLDAIRFATSMRKQSRDLVVPKVGALSRSSNETFYDDKDFWQQSLRWYTTPLPRSTTAIENIDAKIIEIQSIEIRLENWYAKTDEPLKTITTYEDFAVDMALDPEGGVDFQALKQKRWKRLQTDIEAANAYYHKINFIKKHPTLFTKVEELGDDSISDDPNFKSKFGFFFAKILLPLSLEYNLMSREAEVNSLANRVCNNLKSSSYLIMLQAITEITGGHHVLVDTFQTILDTYKSNFTCAANKAVDQVNAADLIHLYNEMRWERIKALLLFIEDQGWAEGSGLGSIDHEMNKAGSGFMHSMFLLRDTLRKSENTELLNRLLRTMKWYNDFNEIYQDDSNYLYDGTTADRMRTILLYRLMIILITPNTQKENKVRDLLHLRTWAKHALKINKGLGGVIKPDFTGFHHKTFYGSAYVPHALHNAALVQYLLEGTTNFKLDETSKHNLREALSVLRTTAVKYSSPNGIAGRFPGYNNSILAQHFAAFAYISYSREGATDKAKGRDMFLRLFNHLEPSVKAYLEDGTIKSGIYYWNSIGQLDVFKQISTLPCTVKCTAERSPSGHWSKNFAGLSIHRRSNWAVAAKGFNRYTWDFEGNGRENVFGAFASHGSLQISNSENSLKTYDTTQGWDWTRVPGATTINLELPNVVLNKARNYNPGNFSGGVRFIGSTGSEPKNGAFGMFYKKPNYNLAKNKASPLDTMVFEFKKSYFFYNNLIICLASDIKFQSRDVDNYYAQTTLFQDKLVDPSKASTITYGTTRHDLRLLLKRQYRWTSGATVTLVDTNGNTYQVKNARQQGLNVQVQDQESVAANGCDKTEARYATAWFEHKNKQTLPCTTSAKAERNNLQRKHTRMDNSDEEDIKSDYEDEEANAENHNEEDAPKGFTKTENSDNSNTIENHPTIIQTTSKINHKVTHDKIVKSRSSLISKANISKVTHQKVVHQQQKAKATHRLHSKSALKLKVVNFKKKNAVKSKTNKSASKKYNSTDATFVNGINVNLDNNEPSQAVELPNYHEPSIDYSTENIIPSNKKKPMYLPSEVDKKTNKGIDIEDEEEKVKSIDEKIESEVKDGHANKVEEEDDDDENEDNDEKKNKEEEGMDSLGVDVDYDESSETTSEKDTETAAPSTKKHTTAKTTKTAGAVAAVNASMDAPQLTNQSAYGVQETIDTDTDSSTTTEGGESEATPPKATNDKEAAPEPETSTDMAPKNNMSLESLDTTEDNPFSISTEERTSTNDDTLPKTTTQDQAEMDEAEQTEEDKKSTTAEDKTASSTRVQEAEIKSASASKSTKSSKILDVTTHKEQKPAMKTKEVHPSTSITEADVPKAIDAAVPSVQDATKATSTKYMSNKAAKISPEKTEDVKEKPDLIGDDNEETPSHNIINGTVSAEGNNIDPPIKLLENTTGISADETERVDRHKDMGNTKSIEDNNVFEISNSRDEDHENESIDNHIIGNDKKEDMAEQEKSKKSNKIHDEVNLKENSMTKKTSNGIHEKQYPKLNNLEKGRLNASHLVQVLKNKNVKGKLDSKDKSTFRFEISKSKQINSKEKSKFSSATVKAISDLRSKGVHKEQSAAPSAAKQQRKSKQRKKALGEAMKASRVSSAQIYDSVKDENTNTNETFKQANTGLINGNENSFQENTFPSPLSEKQRRKLKIMQQKHAEVKRKMQIKLRLKSKSATPNKLHKAIKIAIQNVQQDTKENEKENKNTFYYNDTLTNDVNTGQEEGIDQNADKVDQSVRYNDKVTLADTTSTTTSSYEYAIVVDGGPVSLFSRYKVIAQTSIAHAVELTNLPDYTDASTKLFAYSIFQTFSATETISSGPVIKTSMPCMIMAELGTNTLHLAVSNPNINFQDDPSMVNKDTCTKNGRKDIPDKFSPVNSDEVGAKMMFCVEGASTSITVSLRLTKGLSTVLGTVKVDGKLQQNGSTFVSIDATNKVVTFSNLKNGFTTEVALSLV